MERKNFTNAGNSTFYRSLPIGQMSTWIEASGLADTPELDLIIENLSYSREILEIGAAEGRVVQGLLDRGYEGTICAVERNEERCDFLRSKFENNIGVKVLQRDILKDELPFCETGLWLWAGITEFNPVEQRTAIQKLSRYISKLLIIDVPAQGSKTNATTSSSNKTFEIETTWGSLIGYFPCREEIMNYISGTKFDLTKVIPYRTSSDRERELYLLRVR